MKKTILFFLTMLFLTQLVYAQNIIKDSTTIDGLRIIQYQPDPAICSKLIDIKLFNDEVVEVKFTRGCSGNALGIGALIKGMKVNDAIKKLERIPCGKRTTSCPDQLALALKQALNHKPK